MFEAVFWISHTVQFDKVKLKNIYMFVILEYQVIRAINITSQIKSK